MGFNTTVVIMNDALRYIEEDLSFGLRLGRRVREICGARNPLWCRAGNYINAALVVETHHADDIVTVAVGENRGEVVVDAEEKIAELTRENKRLKSADHSAKSMKAANIMLVDEIDGLKKEIEDLKNQIAVLQNGPYR